MRVHLIGLGGAEKTTIGLQLALQLGWSFYDLDDYFLNQVGHIGEFIRLYGHRAYARQNIELYLKLIQNNQESSVIVCSSGFMLYPDDISPVYVDIKQTLLEDPYTFVLFPAFELEICVKEIVYMQLQRSYLDCDAKREELKVRQRFSKYMRLPCSKVLTMGLPEQVAHEIASRIKLLGK